MGQAPISLGGSQLLAIAERIGPPSADEPGSGFSTSTEIWLSSDGTEWELAADGEDLGSLNDVVAGGPGWVAVGSTGADTAAGTSGQPAVLASADGRDWTTTALEGVGELDHVAALPDGRLLAIGCDENPDFNPEPDEASCVSWVWLSADGQAWDRVAELDGHVRGLAVAPDGLVAAVGSPASGGLTAWLSNDGSTWRSTQIGGGSAFAVAMVDERIVVGGDVIGPDGVSVSAVWTSTDSGDTWASVPLERVEGETSGSARMVVNGPSGIVVLGDAFIVGAVPVAWREPTNRGGPIQTPPPSPAAPSPTPVSYVDRAGLPFSVIESRQADTLFERSATCSNPEGGYTVSYPDGWYTNPDSDALPACSWFSPIQFDVPAQLGDGTTVPDEVVIVVDVFEGGVGQILEIPRTLSEEVPLDGRQGYRFEERVNEEPPGYIYSYGAWLDGNHLGRKIAAHTQSAPGREYQMNRAVLDRMMASLELAEQ